MAVDVADASGGWIIDHCPSWNAEPILERRTIQLAHGIATEVAEEPVRSR